MSWILWGALAFILTIINLVRTLRANRNGWTILMFGSLSSACFALLSEYYMIKDYVIQENWSALMDVVPANATVITTAVCIGLVLNLIILLIQFWLKKGTDK